MDASGVTGVTGVGVVDLPPVLREFLLEPEGVIIEDDIQPVQLAGESWAHWGTVTASGHPVMIQVWFKFFHCHPHLVAHRTQLLTAAPSSLHAHALTLADAMEDRLACT
jgi:hypothetical protein